MHIFHCIFPYNISPCSVNSFTLDIYLFNCKYDCIILFHQWYSHFSQYQFFSPILSSHDTNDTSIFANFLHTCSSFHVSERFAMETKPRCVRRHRVVVNGNVLSYTCPVGLVRGLKATPCGGDGTTGFTGPRWLFIDEKILSDRFHKISNEIQWHRDKNSKKIFDSC